MPACARPPLRPGRAGRRHLAQFMFPPAAFTRRALCALGRFRGLRWGPPQAGGCRISALLIGVGPPSPRCAWRSSAIGRPDCHWRVPGCRAMRPGHLGRAHVSPGHAGRRWGGLLTQSVRPRAGASFCVAPAPGSGPLSPQPAVSRSPPRPLGLGWIWCGSRCVGIAPSGALSGLCLVVIGRADPRQSLRVGPALPGTARTSVPRWGGSPRELTASYSGMGSPGGRPAHGFTNPRARSSVARWLKTFCHSSAARAPPVRRSPSPVVASLPRASFCPRSGSLRGFALRPGPLARYLSLCR